MLLFCQQQQQQRQQPSSISHQFPQVFSSSRVSSRLVSLISSLRSSVLIGLGTFSVRFCGLFVLPCLAVLVPGVAFGTLLSAAAAAASTAAAVYFPQVFNSNRFRSNVRLFLVRFCGLFVLRCLAVLAPGGSSSSGSSLVSLISSLPSVPSGLQF